MENNNTTYEFNLTPELKKKINLSIRAGIQREFYPELVEILIGLKYNVKQELAIHRQKETKQKEWQEYDTYCEECKAYAKELLGIN